MSVRLLVHKRVDCHNYFDKNGFFIYDKINRQSQLFQPVLWQIISDAASHFYALLFKITLSKLYSAKLTSFLFDKVIAATNERHESNTQK